MISWVLVWSSGYNPTLEPFPGFLLHFQVELVRRWVQAAALAFRRARFLIAAPDLFKGCAHSVRSEKLVLGAVDDQHCARRNQRGQIGEIQVAVEANDVESKADRVNDVSFDLMRI